MQEETVNGWQLWNTKELLPKSAAKFIIEHDILKFSARVHLIFYKGDEWIMVTDSASSYKHRAKWMIWHKTYQLCAWSDESMRAAVVSLMYNRNPPFDLLNMKHEVEG